MLRHQHCTVAYLRLGEVLLDDGGLDAHEVAGQDGPFQQREVPRADEGDLVERDARADVDTEVRVQHDEVARRELAL